MNKSEIPSFVIDKIKSIHERTEISVDEIQKDYIEIFQDPFIQEDEQFKTDEERHKYASAVLYTRYISRPPVKEFDIIPIGFSPIRLTRSTKKEMSAIFAFVKTRTGVKLKRIVLRGEMAYKIHEITPRAKYTVKLGQFSDGGDLIADNRARFENPVLVNMTDEQLLSRLGAKRVTVKTAEKFPSKVGSDGYVDSTDLRVIRGIIVRMNQGRKDENSPMWGVYTIADETVDDEPKVTADGRVLRPGFTCWVSPHLMVYTEESEADFIGTVQIGRKSGEPFMNCIAILPVHAKRMASMSED